MTEELLHDAVLIWLLRRLDLSKARREVFEYFQMWRSLIFLIDMNFTTMTAISARHALMYLTHSEPSFLRGACVSRLLQKNMPTP